MLVARHGLLTALVAVAAIASVDSAGSVAQAEFVVYRYEGAIDRVGFDSPSDPFRGTISPGDGFRGTIEIDTTVADNFPDNPERGYYEMGLLSIDGITAKIGPHKFFSDLPTALEEYHVVTMFNDFFGVDELTISTSDGFVTHRGPAVKNLAVDHISIILTDNTMSMLEDVNLPFPVPENVESLSTNLFAIGGTIGPNNYSVTGHLTSLTRGSKRQQDVALPGNSFPSTAPPTPEPATWIVWAAVIAIGSVGTWRPARHGSNQGELAVGD